MKTLKLKDLALEYDRADDAGFFEEPHPIFLMAEEIDRLRADLSLARLSGAQLHAHCIRMGAALETAHDENCTPENCKIDGVDCTGGRT